MTDKILKIDGSLLKNEEKAAFALRKLYTDAGYTKFKMSKFEEYDLYVENKDFLASKGVITFNDTNGKLLALKPDVTLSIIKNSRDTGSGAERYYYSENVYRISENSGEYREIMQTGLECIGNIGNEENLEAVKLAMESLKLISENYTLGISHAALINLTLDKIGIANSQRRDVIEAIADKNIGRLKSLMAEEQYSFVKPFMRSYASLTEATVALEDLCCGSEELAGALSELKYVTDELVRCGFGDNLKIDYSIISSVGYYSGIVFRGFINGVGTRVLAGGRYDGLMKRMGKAAKAIGFAVYLDTLERIPECASELDTEYINVALPKGRLGERVYDMFERSGYDCPSIKEPNRKLIFENSEKKLRFFWVKPSDVAIYVERGAADIGVVGRDILLEYEPDVYELLDLDVGKCRMAVAARADFKDDMSKTLRVATKFSNIAKKYYAGMCRDIDIIHLNGSIEIAPILGLSDVIVDIVETGKTLLENNLCPYETITEISARLISNKSAYSFKSEKIEKIKKALFEEVRGND